jgi:hypothetical protein
LRAATRAYQLHHLEHRDPADRFLIATAIELACPLVTDDDRIARFGKKHGTQYRFIAGAWHRMSEVESGAGHDHFDDALDGDDGNDVTMNVTDAVDGCLIRW